VINCYSWIGVGPSRVVRDGKTTLVGDVEFAVGSQHAGAITPVPGGVSPDDDHEHDPQYGRGSVCAQRSPRASALVAGVVRMDRSKVFHERSRVGDGRAGALRFDTIALPPKIEED
jgi:hypothetical protein